MSRPWPSMRRLLGLDKVPQLLAGSPSPAPSVAHGPRAAAARLWPSSGAGDLDSRFSSPTAATAAGPTSWPATEPDSTDWRLVVQELLWASEQRRRLAAELVDRQPTAEVSSARTTPQPSWAAADCNGPPGTTARGGHAPAPLALRQPVPKAVIFWDWENYALPGTAVAVKLVTALGQLVRERALGEVSEIRLYSGQTVSISETLAQAGITVIHVPHGRKKEVVDRRMQHDMWKLAHFEPNPSTTTAVIISSDSDFTPTLLSLQTIGLKTMLIADPGLNKDKTNSLALSTTEPTASWLSLKDASRPSRNETKEAFPATLTSSAKTVEAPRVGYSAAKRGPHRLLPTVHRRPSPPDPFGASLPPADCKHETSSRISNEPAVKVDSISSPPAVETAGSSPPAASIVAVKAASPDVGQTLSTSIAPDLSDPPNGMSDKTQDKNKKAVDATDIEAVVEAAQSKAGLEAAKAAASLNSSAQDLDGANDWIDCITEAVRIIAGDKKAQPTIAKVLKKLKVVSEKKRTEASNCFQEFAQGRRPTDKLVIISGCVYPNVTKNDKARVRKHQLKAQLSSTVTVQPSRPDQSEQQSEAKDGLSDSLLPVQAPWVRRALELVRAKGCNQEPVNTLTVLDVYKQLATDNATSSDKEPAIDTFTAFVKAVNRLKPPVLVIDLGHLYVNETPTERQAVDDNRLRRLNRPDELDPRQPAEVKGSVVLPPNVSLDLQPPASLPSIPSPPSSTPDKKRLTVLKLHLPKSSPPPPTSVEPADESSRSVALLSPPDPVLSSSASEEPGGVIPLPAPPSTPPPSEVTANGGADFEPPPVSSLSSTLVQTTGDGPADSEQPNGSAAAPLAALTRPAVDSAPADKPVESSHYEAGSQGPLFRTPTAGESPGARGRPATARPKPKEAPPFLSLSSARRE